MRQNNWFFQQQKTFLIVLLTGPISSKIGIADRSSADIKTTKEEIEAFEPTTPSNGGTIATLPNLTLKSAESMNMSGSGTEFQTGNV